MMEPTLATSTWETGTIGRETYALVPAGIGKGNLLAKGIERLRLVLLLLDGGDGLGGRLDDGRRLGFCLGLGLGLGVEGADEKLGLILLQDTFVVVLPELLGGVLASDALEDLLAACKPQLLAGCVCIMGGRDRLAA